MVSHKKKRKYASGEATQYISRKQAMKKLALNLKDFRRLCILKGVYPREPKKRTRAQKGDTHIKTLYQVKDIRFLLHEPIVWKFRDTSSFVKKLKKFTAKRDFEAADRIKDNLPKFTLDHIVRERYPTFIDAIRDLEDCLCLCFLYSTFPTSSQVNNNMIRLCKRLSVEFQHYVIEARALRRVFCSIKGYYFQADIKGQTVTWVIPHSFGWQAPGEVDMRIMSIFTDFYTTMLGFINFRLYNSINLVYPPKLQGLQSQAEEDQVDQENDRVFALNQSLHRTVIPEDVSEMDKIPMYEDDAAMESARKEAEAVEAQVKLFQGLKFFLGREVPREQIVFMIRSMGGEVSWESTCAPGSTYKEGDERITHHIADREVILNKKLGRFYVQPQWIFDSINQRKKLNEKDYALGETLPPHLSPFVEERRREGDYIPPEEKALLEKAHNSENLAEKTDEESEEEEDSEEEEEGGEEESEEDSEGEEEEKDEEVKVGQKEKVDKNKEKDLEEKEQFRLREMMVPRKHRHLYSKMRASKNHRIKNADEMAKKREQWEQENATPKSKKKATKRAAAAV